MKDRTHSFSVEEAQKYGIEKALLLNNLRFWLDRHQANGTHIHEHTDGKEYHWVFNSRTAWGKLFPYMRPQSIARWLLELEKEGIIISGEFNTNKYDKTKWYSMPSFLVSTTQNEQSIAQNEQWGAQNEQSTAQNEQPIPVSYTVSEHDTDTEPSFSSYKGTRTGTKKPRTPREFTNARRADRGKLPLRTPRTEKQEHVFSALKWKDYFRDEGMRLQGMKFFLVNNPERESAISARIIRVGSTGISLKELIDWWFEGAGKWADYEPEQCFTERMVERFLNKDKGEKGEDLIPERI